MGSHFLGNGDAPFCDPVRKEDVMNSIPLWPKVDKRAITKLSIAYHALASALTSSRSCQIH
jgi:hypothetical protein